MKRAARWVGASWLGGVVLAVAVSAWAIAVDNAENARLREQQQREDTLGAPR